MSSLRAPSGDGGRANLSGGFHWGSVLAGLVASFALSLVIAGIVALIVYATAITEQSASGFLLALGLLSVALGAGYGAHRAHSLGWAHGLAVGVCYVLTSLALQPLLFSAGWSAGGTIMRLLWGAAAGTLGGIIGVNL